MVKPSVTGYENLNQCDIVMKGGVTSGVVYPQVAVELSETYRFRQVGGSSAGAIAAVMVATAELGRRRWINGESDKDPFVELNCMPADLGSELSTLFQPSVGTKVPFEAIMRCQVPDRSTMFKLFAVAMLPVQRGFGVFISAFALAMVPAFMFDIALLGSCRGVKTRGKTTYLDHFPRALVLKPHGSFDWYRFGNEARRCGLDLDAERLMITPGINKYRAGYDSPFDKHRDLANDHINKAGRLLVVGYGFNDDHLETHLVKRIMDGTPTLILNQLASPKIQDLADKSPRCVSLSKPTALNGAEVVTNGHRFEHHGHDLWDLGILTKELLT